MKEIVYLKLFLSKIYYSQCILTQIYKDNQTYILFTRDNTIYSHIKYIIVKYHFT
jgi:hypothetical protein